MPSPRKKPPAAQPGALPSVLTADDILGAPDLEIRAVEVPEWGRTVHLRSLTAEEGVAVGKRMQGLTAENDTDAAYIILEASLCAPDGERLIRTEDQARRLRTRSGRVILRLQQIALELQGWSGPGGARPNV